MCGRESGRGGVEELKIALGSFSLSRERERSSVLLSFALSLALGSFFLSREREKEAEIKRESEREQHTRS